MAVMPKAVDKTENPEAAALDSAVSQDAVVTDGPPKFLKTQDGEIRGLVQEAMASYRNSGIEAQRQDTQGRKWRFFFNSENDQARFSIRVTWGACPVVGYDWPWSVLAVDDVEDVLTDVIKRLAATQVEAPTS